MRISIFMIGIFFLALLAACGPAQDGIKMDVSTAAVSWEVELVLTGGFVGARVNVNVKSSGTVLVVDAKKNKQVELQLTATELKNFNGLVENIGQFQPPVSVPACTDCFQYELNVMSPDQNFKATVNDTNLDASGLKPIIDVLMELQKKALSG